MEAVFYSLAFAGSKVAPLQLVRSLRSLRKVDPQIPVFVFLFGDPIPGFVHVLEELNAEVRPLGSHRAYIARTEPERAELFSLDPKIHRWLVLEEPELKRSSRLLYIDSDTYFFGPARGLFDRYCDADLYAREEPLCRRSIHGYKRSYIDEEAIADLQASEGLSDVPPFNTGVCLLSRQMADAISIAVPRYFDYILRFFAWFYLHPLPGMPSAIGSAEIDDRFIRPALSRALPYPSENRWIFDQVALWLALGELHTLRYADFAPSDVWQGAEFKQMSPVGRLPTLSHYFGGNTVEFFDLLKRTLGPDPRGEGVAPPAEDRPAGV